MEAIKAGKRGSTMCEITEDALCVGAINADFEECDRLGRRLGATLEQAEEIRVITPNGTDIRGYVKGRPVQYETGLFREPGQFAAFPDSEINISPLEGSAEGKVVGDVSVMSVGITIGGRVIAPNHIDVMYKDTTVYFDGKVVLEKGVCKL